LQAVAGNFSISKFNVLYHFVVGADLFSLAME